MTANDATRLATLHQIFDEPLTNQQKDIILMYAMGSAVETIADLKKISFHTVRKQLDNIRLQFGELTLSAIKSIIFIRLVALNINQLSILNAAH
nr:hypothetical protein [uncultured bacterium]